MSAYQPGPEFAAERDAVDPLGAFRDRFYVPPDTIYLDGNSLGLLSRDAEASVLQALDAWRRQAIDGWMAGAQPWFWTGETLGGLQADLVGALPEEVVVTGAITQNLHALLATFFQPSAGRTKIVADALDFPSDVYALQSWLRLRGLDPTDHLVLVPTRDGRTIDEDDVIAAMTPDVALVWLPTVLYRSGQLLDVERLAREARARGILLGLDLAHSAGGVPHRLHEWNVDFGVWCTYKYLNAGPGAVGSLYVHQRHFGRTPGLAGWWGSDKDRQFDMALEFSAAAGAGAWQISTPAVLGAASLYGSLAMFREAGLGAIRAKSLELTGYLMYLADELLMPLGFSVGTPRQPGRRGGHVALEHPDAMRIARALRARNVVPDFRQPNVIRLAPVALYTTYAEVWQAVQTIAEVVGSGAHTAYATTRSAVA
jgi:kynureninase